MEADLIYADFSLYVLQALLDDGDKGCRGNQGSIDVGLADVALYTKGECWVGEAWKKHRSFVMQNSQSSNAESLEQLCIKW